MGDQNKPDENGSGVFDPDRNLRALFMEAYRRYQSEVIGCGKSYDRYADDFICDHRFNYAVSAWEANQKYTNLNRIDTLLKTRRDLVEKYFLSKTFGPTDFAAMFSEFNRGTAPISPVIAGGKTMNFGCDLTAMQTQAIADIANDLNIFRQPVSGEDMAKLFSPSPHIRLISANNRKLAILFDSLSYEKLIAGDWQKVIAATGVIISSANAPLTQSKLSTALNEARGEESAAFVTIRKRVHEIAVTT